MQFIFYVFTVTNRCSGVDFEPAFNQSAFNLSSGVNIQPQGRLQNEIKNWIRTNHRVLVTIRSNYPDSLPVPLSKQTNKETNKQNKNYWKLFLAYFEFRKFSVFVIPALRNEHKHTRLCVHSLHTTSHTSMWVCSVGDDYLQVTKLRYKKQTFTLLIHWDCFGLHVPVLCRRCRISFIPYESNDACFMRG